MSKENIEPTIISLNDSIDLMKRIHGEEWEKDDIALGCVIYAALSFKEDHVKETIPQHWDLYMEFKTGKRKFPALAGLYFMGYIEDNLHNPVEIISDEPFGTSPVNDCCWKIINE